MSVEKNLKKLNIDLPKATDPVGSYVATKRMGNLLYISGQISIDKDGNLIKGKLGKELNVDQGYEAARLVCIQLLTALKNHIGDLSKVEKIVKVLGMVNAESNFDNHPKVINGCSDLLVEVFGDKGKHARSAVGMGSLPFQIPVEIEMIVQINLS